MASRAAISLIRPHVPQPPLKKRNTHLLFSSTSNVACSNRSEMSLCAGSHLIPHPRKVEKGGEDALLISGYNGGVLAIADGVSGWAERDINPALFPQELMANIATFLGIEEINNDPKLLLQKAHASTRSTGSSTIIIAMLERNGTLKIANVGDCGLKLIRKGELVFSTAPQEHYFDCPFQLSSEIAGQTYEDAMVCHVQVMEGDTIVMGSDGLFDNVFDHEIVSVISMSKDLSEAAKALATLANVHSRDSKFDSPYSIEARSHGFDIPLWKKLLGGKLTGGKLDDITVIVGQVVTSPLGAAPLVFDVARHSSEEIQNSIEIHGSL